MTWMKFSCPASLKPKIIFSSHRIQKNSSALGGRDFQWENSRVLQLGFKLSQGKNNVLCVSVSSINRILPGKEETRYTCVLTYWFNKWRRDVSCVVGTKQIVISPTGLAPMPSSGANPPSGTEKSVSWTLSLRYLWFGDAPGLISMGVDCQPVTDSRPAGHHSTTYKTLVYFFLLQKGVPPLTHS